ncbi:GGDEF domain-containing protein [Sulfuriflexus sp.]|uniref:GGDEF domain-containing protein n=1 Tax=Sulfuriflexus sp. TaxID=2015443 RepID=UPI0028CF2663|nr:GGDEF domain-containing protein [Sulfuriflexus sp.]MDT8403660.1 GGDEF domain-containing protein [Sulfuriflexus sp.]
MKAETLSATNVRGDNYRIFLVINYIAYLGCAVHSLFIPLFYWLGVTPLVFLNIFSVSAWALAFFINRHGRHREAFILLVIEIILHAFLAVFFLGWQSGFHYYLLPLVPLIFFHHKQSTRSILLETTLLFIAYIGLYLYTHYAAFQVGAIDPDILDALQVMNIAVNFAVLGMLGYFFRIASIRAEKDMERLATTDALTRLYNRRKMREMLERERLRFERDRKPFIIAITDIDYFKSFNDLHGHDCGDYVLQKVSRLMQNCLRKQDVIARWGGEEFLIMLPETEIEGGVKAIEKIRETIAETRYRFGGEEFKVTMTFGVAIFDGTQHIDGCIKQADQMLYAGKHGGRNCVVAVGA